jgi:hypothetical protein
MVSRPENRLTATQRQENPNAHAHSQHSENNASDLIERLGNATIPYKPKQKPEYQASNDQGNYDADSALNGDHDCTAFGATVRATMIPLYWNRSPFLRQPRLRGPLR